jgi:hypothetical protein
LRFVAFFVSVLASVGAIGALNWWLDPFGDRYDSTALRLALAQPHPCFVSQELVREPVWPQFKLDLFRRRAASVVVVGTSRVAKLGAWPGERNFANIGMPGVGPESLAPLFRILHRSTEHRRLTIYLGVDAFWFGPGWRTRVSFTHSYVREAKYLFAGETLTHSLGELRRAPGALFHPRALHPIELERARVGCIVDTGGAALHGAADAWGPDGTLYWEYELTGAAAPHKGALVGLYHAFFSGSKLAAGNVHALDRALAVARRYHWRVVGATLPIADKDVRQLRSDPDTAGLWADFRRRMPAIFARHGFRFLDLTSPASAGCSQTSFSFHDGGHPDVPCSRRIRRLLDAAARTS